MTPAQRILSPPSAWGMRAALAGSTLYRSARFGSSVVSSVGGFDGMERAVFGSVARSEGGLGGCCVPVRMAPAFDESHRDRRRFGVSAICALWQAAVEVIVAA